MLDSRALGMLSAALRHVRDAEHLASAAAPDRSTDQAYHLAGFGPECARKATLSRKTFDMAIGHGVGAGAEAALRLAIAFDPAARRYDVEGWGDRYQALASWNVGARYERTGRRSEAEADAVVSEARDVVDRIVFALWADGTLPEKFEW